MKVARTTPIVSGGRLRQDLDVRYGRLTIIHPLSASKGVWRLRCVCDCGTIKDIVWPSLRSGRAKSCGCLHSENIAARSFRHGLSRSPEYRTYRHMLDRCLRPNHPNFADYGGRGIKVCERWRKSFENFYRDMGPRPSPRFELDRIDNGGNYSPDNCRWRTRLDQSNNKRSNHFLEAFGERKTIMQWSRDVRCACKRNTLYSRVHAGWPDELAIATASSRAKE